MSVRERLKAPRERLKALRAQMRRARVTHYLVPSTDEHLNEYLPAWGKRREDLSGFSGSAGDLLVGLADAWLFTDGRYHIQAESELRGSGIRLSKVGAKGHRTLKEHLVALARGKRKVAIGFDPLTVSAATERFHARALADAGGELRPVDGNLVDRQWRDRPPPPRTPLVPVATRLVGLAPAAKLQRVRKALAAAGADALVVVKLDQLAWLLNLRSRDDVPFNPVFEGYALVDPRRVHVFLHEPAARLPEDCARRVPGLSCHEHDEFLPFLRRLRGARLLVDASGVTAGVRRALDANKAVTVVAGESPIEELKAKKTAAELVTMRRANLLASRAKTQALRWLEAETAAGRTVTERAFKEEIERRYAALPDYWGLSFETIASTGPNGAIVHYKDAGDIPLRDGELFLIDSGVQVAGGTTDDTRTVIVGRPGGEQRRLYTLVLKAHIAAASQRFPAGTSGAALDAVCRGPLWREQLDYSHGTGHGVGRFLNVHEGPFSISARRPMNDVPLEPGMITSIEPGYYRAGWGGIRLENLYVVVSDGEGADGKEWLRLEPLTFVPFDERLIDETLLEAGEREWLATYQAAVRQQTGTASAAT